MLSRSVPNPIEKTGGKTRLSQKERKRRSTVVVACPDVVKEIAAWKGIGARVVPLIEIQEAEVKRKGGMRMEGVWGKGRVVL
jgi:hypothetical protein